MEDNDMQICVDLTPCVLKAETIFPACDRVA